MSQGALTFMHLAIGLGGAGIAIYGAQKVCDKKINKTAYESCLKQTVKKGSTKETIKKACDTKYKPGGDIIPTIIMWSGMGIILLAYVILSYLNGGYDATRLWRRLQRFPVTTHVFKDPRVSTTPDKKWTT